MKSQVMHSRWLLSALLAATLGCGGDGGGSDEPRDDGGLDGGRDSGTLDAGTDGQVGGDGSVPSGTDLWALTSTKKLLQLSASNAAVVRALDLSLPEGESVWAADVRPADGKIYALTSLGNLYTVNPETGAFSDKKTLSAEGADVDATDPFVGLNGTAFAADFNPVVDRLRVVSNTGQNLRVNVETGKVVTDTAVTPPTTVISAAAYSNNWPRTPVPNPPPPCGTHLFVLDAASGKLHLQSPPNAGTLVEVGALEGVAVGETVDTFDIVTSASGQNAGLIVGSAASGESLYQLDLYTGKATLLGTVAGQGKIVALLGRPLSTALSERTGELIATTLDDKVVTFDRLLPGTFCSEVAITGLEPGEFVVGGDVRPRDKGFYVLTRQGDMATNGKLRRLDVATGVLEDGLSLVPADQDPYAGLVGSDYGVDFNPATDLLRVVSSSRQNLRVNPISGQVITDTVITPTGTALSEVAHTNPAGVSEPGTSVVTTLYAIDGNADLLGRIGDDPAGASPNAGVFQSTVDLGVGVFPPTGGDIEPVTGVALLAIGNGGDPASTTLYRVNMGGTPLLTSLGKIGPTTTPATDLAISSLSFAPKP